MHPAFSVIFFTVASGAGFGLISLLFTPTPSSSAAASAPSSW
jgi:DMSO reductase anchor subunit